MDISGNNKSVVRSATATVSSLTPVTTMTMMMLMAMMPLAGAGLRPIIGWTTGSRYPCITDCQHYPEDCISEHLIKVMADFLSLSSFRSSGYEYVVIGDCWMDQMRDSKGRLRADRRRFPGGMADLVSYVHGKNLKVGLLLDLSASTCSGHPGSWDNFRLDARTVADWNVDMVTVTGCAFNQVSYLDEAYARFGRELMSVGRPILYACDWPARSLERNWGHPSYAAAAQACNTFKIVQPVSSSDHLFRALQSVQVNSYLYRDRLGNGTYIDLDEMIIGARTLGEDQERFQLAFWAIVSSPMLISSDLTDMGSRSKRILLNREALGIQQDPLGTTGTYKTTIDTVSIWTKSILPSGSFAVGFFCTVLMGLPSQVSVQLSAIGVSGSSRYNATEVFSGHRYGVFKPWHYFNCEVEPMSSLLFKFVPV